MIASQCGVWSYGTAAKINMTLSNMITINILNCQIESNDLLESYSKCVADADITTVCQNVQVLFVRNANQ